MGFCLVRISKKFLEKLPNVDKMNSPSNIFKLSSIEEKISINQILGEYSIEKNQNISLE